MARALGIGGVFFKARYPQKLAEWYAAHLGIELHAEFCGACFEPAALPAGAYMVWSLFEPDTTYFAPTERRYMINFIVDDLEGALDQVAAGGGALTGTPETSELGRFGWFIDPEGNKVELWQPPAA